VPTPLGTGPRYHLPAAPPRVLAGKPVVDRTCTSGGMRYGVHVELFANRRVLLLPSGIGVAAPRLRRGGDVLPRGCSYAVRTRTPIGVVEVRRGSAPTVADLFAVWGQPLGRHRLAGFRGDVRAYVGGRPWRGAAGSILLRRHAEIVLEVGGYVPPHTSFLFAGGL
jgi:hypothetical protein